MQDAKAIVWKAVREPNIYTISKHHPPDCSLIIKGERYIILKGSGRHGLNQVIKLNKETNWFHVS